ncbi:FAD-binding protein [Pseudofrankia sp. DC12]|uniref:FAD-binding protein n=1 Tax=Pseudofrankia sp. DC12 TaxID=683315 RepID=UPI0005F7BCC0|nr:FAD-binding protein [Pseudofrankia sp. DC12]
MASDAAMAANWAGNVRFGAERVVAPESVEELQEVVAGTRKARALGTGHSFSRIADTDGTLISTARLPRRIRIDAGGTVTVSGGARYGDLARELETAGWALRNLGSLPHISIAGACATGTHGSGNGNGNLATSVAGLELVTASGELASVRRGVDPDFEGHVIALGALGVTVAVTLDLVPTFQVRQLVYEGLTQARLLASVDDIFAAAYSVGVFTGWDPASSQVWLKQRVDEPDGDGEPPAERFGARLATRPLHPVPGIDPAHTTRQLGVPGPWHERLPHFRLDFTPSAGDELQTEYFVARKHAAAAIEAIFAIGATVRPALQISEIRTVAADSLWLSPAYQRDVMALHFTWLPDEATVLPAVAAVERQLAPFAPAPHWGKVFSLPPDAVRAGYPCAAQFLALAARRDPGAVFRNQYLDTYLPMG